MEKRDIISSLFLLALGVFFAYGSFMYSIWGRYGPGPGFFPLLFGILLSLFSVLLLIDGMKRMKRRKKRNRSGTDIQRFSNFNKIAAYLVCCVCVYLVMKPLGFLITIFLFLTAALPLSGQKSLKSVMTVAAIASVSIFALFLQLNVPLPLGPLQTIARLWGR